MIEIAVVKFMEADLHACNHVTEAELEKMNEEDFNMYVVRIKAEHKLWWMVKNDKPY